jgi:L-2,4-diaminobutyrate decarboxylase
MSSRSALETTAATATDATTALRAAFDADAFRRAGHAVVDTLADALAASMKREGPVLPNASPAEMLERFRCAFETGFPREQDAAPGLAGASAEESACAGPREPFVDALVAVLRDVVSASNRLHHPRYVGHQVTAPLPIAALADLTSSLLNNGMAVYEMGPASTAIERLLVRFFADRLGLPPGADGIFTSGGSAGNLTALLAARQRTGGDVFRDGLSPHERLVLVASDQTHYCVKRAAQIMGLGASGVVVVPTDAHFRMDPAALEQTLTSLAGRVEGGRRTRVMAVVASAGSTSTGALDPLDAIADVCERHGVWLHVDGAHGAALALSDRHRDALRGIARADSVVWDAHKMMLMPALSTMVLFRDGRASYAAFAQEASYLFGGSDPEVEWQNGAVRTLECTKTMMALKLYVALRAFGRRFFAAYVERMHALAATFAEMIEASDDFDLATWPDFNIVCFRHVPSAARSDAAVDTLQDRIRDAVVKSGDAYLVRTELRGRVHLRVTLINPLTEPGDLEALLAAIRSAARGV